MNKLFDALALIGSILLVATSAVLLYMVASIVFPPTVKIIPEDPSQVITQDEMQLFFGEVCNGCGCAELHR